jgi:hypothetical protein
MHAPAPHDTTFTGPCRSDPEKDISAELHLCNGVQLATSHTPFFNGGQICSPSSSSQGSSSVPLLWCHNGGSSFSSSAPPCHHGGSSAPSSCSPCHCGGSSFSSSSIGIVRAMAGLLHRPPVLGGSASTAIPPSVTREVQDVSSLAATPLTNVRVLPPMASSHFSQLGSSRDVSGGVAPPPCSRWVLLFCSVYCPHPVCGCSAFASSSPCSWQSYSSSHQLIHVTLPQVWQ